ncbi:phenylalanine 4-monooxygenase [Parvularcula sp. ZS-1/3]|uniref:Phenylalanine-4-hydroxylase n=1 Tax=Parvularcula mediterranea TaxID=2732508 RepID=A0A7Y3RNI2_9PROT|nr:phenylalanine 4-monooxygenase [Parvularcula mediterranea]NNU17354.1 phenylalanine 4-monooxygenase [Parvularcula mediterranea]
MTDTPAFHRASQAPADDYTIPQDWESYTEEEHNTWDVLYKRLMKVLPGRADQAFIDGLKALDLGKGGIPHFERMSDELEALTGWRVVAVPGLVPDEVFFDHLANRRFPAGNFIRKPDQLDYIQEPDVFHDVFGHVPMLSNPVFADYMQAYGQGGLKSLNSGCLKNLAALYWYTVEFGLIQTDEGMRIYGAGIVSSPAESVFSLESDSPNRIGFDVERLMKTAYRIDDFQQTYFVIDSYEDLLEKTLRTEFAPLYERLREEGCASEYRQTPADILETDKVFTEGDQAYANRGGRFAAE